MSFLSAPSNNEMYQMIQMCFKLKCINLYYFTWKWEVLRPYDVTREKWKCNKKKCERNFSGNVVRISSLASPHFKFEIHLSMRPTKLRFSPRSCWKAKLLPAESQDLQLIRLVFTLPFVSLNVAYHFPYSASLFSNSIGEYRSKGWWIDSS